MERKPERIDFMVSNDRHHLAMTLPVIERLGEDFICRVLSLCELRGMVTPHVRLRELGIEAVPLMRWRLRRSPVVERTVDLGGSADGGSSKAPLRRWLHRSVWSALVKPRLAWALASPPSLVVLPNDAAYPYDRIAATLTERRIPFMLQQEGIRFPLPNAVSGRPYGGGGAAAIAAWGETSSEYFLHSGAPAERIHGVGSPRFDVISTSGWRAKGEVVCRRLGLEGRTLLLLSNPIDDQGFCSKASKLELVRGFIAGLEPLFAERDFRLVVKLHAGEMAADFALALSGLAYAERILLVTDEPLYPLFNAVQAAVVMASTVGLEALLFDLPLGVLEIPGGGFVHDYVRNGAALGLTLGEPIEPQVRRLMGEWSQIGQASVASYLERSLAVRSDSAAATASLVRLLVAA